MCTGPRARWLRKLRPWPGRGTGGRPAPESGRPRDWSARVLAAASPGRSWTDGGPRDHPAGPGGRDSAGLRELAARAGRRAAGHDRVPAGGAGPEPRGGAAPSAAGRCGAGGPARRPGSSPAAIPRLPDQRSWGFTVQLYSVRSRQSWGHGDLHDLADLTAWSAGATGRGLRAGQPAARGRAAAPGQPVTLPAGDPDVHQPAVPAGRGHPGVRAAGRRGTGRRSPSSPRRCRPATAPADLIDRDAVWRAKRAALELLSEVPLTPQRQARVRRVPRRPRRRTGALGGLVRAGRDARPGLAELAGQVRRPGPRASPPSQPSRPWALRATFHSWLQWQCDQQLGGGAAAGAPGGHAVRHHRRPGRRRAGGRRGRLGAPRAAGRGRERGRATGQLQPARPGLGAAAVAPAAARGGALPAARGPVHRLTPARRRAAGRPRDGPHPAVVGTGRKAARPGCLRQLRPRVLGRRAGRARRPAADALAIGEDLGTVDPWVRTHLADHHILGTTMLWFARQRDGSPLPPRRWRRACMATVGTHDVPPVAGFVTGDQVRVRAGLGLLTRPLDAELAESAATLARWQVRPGGRGAASRTTGGTPGPADFTVAMYGYLSRTPAVLTGRVAGRRGRRHRRTQNIPGTSTEYPNWQVPLCDATGAAVLLEDLGPVRAAARHGRAARGAAAGSASCCAAAADRRWQRSARATSSRPSASSRASAGVGRCCSR